MAAKSRSKTKRGENSSLPSKGLGGSQLWTLWQKYKLATVENLSQNINSKFTALSRSVCSQIAADAARFSRLNDADEAVYAHLVELMGVYRHVISQAENYPFESPTVRALIGGLCEVLNSRLREFEEARQGDTASNPITAEKKAIIDSAQASASGLIDRQRRGFVTGLRDEDSQEWDESFDMILRADFYDMYTSYREGLRFCLARMDDLHGRKVARHCTELIEREWEELGNIIKVQVLALENAIAAHEAENPYAMTEDVQVTAISVILDSLREAYQQTGPIIQNLQKMLNEPPKKPMPARPFEEFEHTLLASLDNSVPKAPERKQFFAALDAETMTLLDNIAVDYKQAAYRLQRIISAEVLLADEVAGVFSKALQSLPNLSENSDDTSVEHDILLGIHETIDIKISGLKESTQNFNRQGMDILKDFSAEAIQIPDGERQSVLEGVRNAWLENPPAKETEVPAFFKNCQAGEAFQPGRERMEKQVNLYTEILDKSSLRFKKEVLLYEICTFEEILTHSVSRLRDSARLVVLVAVSMLDDTFRALEVILKKNNIAVIRPDIREIFNAKEHEVLVAEKQEGFEKGEIIKVVTAGYRTAEQVILRANVIAAR
ncbi:MAG: nucleotide exchange factor GrpE [Defluviitaleaceae bacterium]|nr:nucleotide exchange factor GrpE [Defluviitaleaceae bacterium]